MSGGPLRVALCFGTYPPERNGGADFVANFAVSLAERGMDVMVLTSPAAGAPEVEEPAPRVAIHRVVDDWSLRSISLDRANAALAEAGAQVVHVFFPDSVLQASYRLPARLGFRRVPLVTTYWSLGLGRRSPLATRVVSAALLARSGVLTSHDPAYMRVLGRLAGRMKPVRWLPVGNNVGAVPPGVDRGEARRAVGLDPDAAWLGFFGQLDPARGVEDLLRALALLRRERDIKLVMIGSASRPERYIGGYLEEILALPGRLGVADAVVWTDYLQDEEVALHLRALDLCVLPYRRNSIGRSALAAAFAIGVPTVLAGTAPLVEPLRDGEHVRLVSPGDAEALSRTVAALLDDAGERERLTLGARDAARFFTWPEIARRAEEIYRLALC